MQTSDSRKRAAEGVGAMVQVPAEAEAPTVPRVRTFGSLNVGDVTKTATFNDDGLKITGKIRSIWHKTTFKGEPQTTVYLAVNGGEVKLDRPAFTEIELIDAGEEQA